MRTEPDMIKTEGKHYEVACTMVSVGKVGNRCKEQEQCVAFACVS